jgi:hypothetical protein
MHVPSGVRYLAPEVCQRFSDEQEIILSSSFTIVPLETHREEYSHPFLPSEIIQCRIEIDEELPTLYPLRFTDEDVVFGMKRRTRNKKTKSKKLKSKKSKK